MTQHGNERPAPPLAISVAWGYALAFLLMAFLFLVLLPEPEGPSPWDARAFQAAILELAANFRLLDELADMGFVRVADVGTGFLTVDLDLIGISNRSFGWAPFVLAIGLVSLALLLRGLRQRLLANHFGLPHGARGQTSSYFFGRGMNLFFPFGPGDLATARVLDASGAEGAGEEVVFHNRVFDLVGILAVLVTTLVLLGWGGAITTVAWTLFLVMATVSLTRPLGWTEGSGGGPLRGLLAAFNAPALSSALSRMAATPGLLLGLALMSAATVFIEVLGFWSLKQAFSSPLDAYVIMKDLSFLRFTAVIAAAGITRIIPYTFASLGIFELVTVVLFRVHGESYLTATTVALLDSALLNGLTLVFFVLATLTLRMPSVLETWQMFYRDSLARAEAATP
jgi:hypothetical protein